MARDKTLQTKDAIGKIVKLSRVNDTCIANMMNVILLSIFLLVSAIASASEVVDNYNKLMREAINMSSTDILNMAIKATNGGEEKEALVLYAIVCSRNDIIQTEAEIHNVVDAYLQSGYIYYWRGHFARAFSLYSQGLKISEYSEMKPHVIELYKCIGNVYFMFKDYETALEYYTRGLELNNEFPDNQSAYQLQLNVACTYTNLGKIKEAYSHYDKAQYVDHNGSPQNIFFGKYYLAFIKEADERYIEAVKLLKPLLPFIREKHLPVHYTCSIYESLYRLYEKIGDQDSLFYYMDKCLTTAEHTGYLPLFTEVLEKLSQVHNSKGNRFRANQYMVRYKSIVDSTFNIREFSKVKNAQFLYEMEKIEKKIANLNAEKKRGQTKIRYQRAAIALILIVTLIITTLLIVVWRQKQSLNESYRSLFCINKKMNSMYKQLVQADLKSRAFVEKCPNDEKEDKDAKYKSSNLKDEQWQKLIDQITHIMENTLEFANEDFSLDRLATLTNSNSKYISQVINEHYGKNFNNFINEYRVRLACSRLTDEENYGYYTIHGIANSVGYRSNTTFINVFRKAIGITPSVYQRMAKEDREKKNEAQEAF